jgi:hypothetical protein
MTTDYAARADEVRALSDLPAADRLVSSPLADVLLWGLSHGHSDPVLGVLRNVPLDLELLTAARRLDTVVELLRRLHRAHEAAAKEGAP